MRPSLSAPLALAAGLATLALAGPAVAAPAAVQVGFNKDDVFGPADVTVSTGEAVTWQWVSGTHNVHFTDGPKTDSDFRSSGGKDFAQTFSQAGTFHYRCDAHDGMTGTVTVVQAGAAGGSTGSTGTTGSTAPTT